MDPAGAGASGPPAWGRGSGGSSTGDTDGAGGAQGSGGGGFGVLNTAWGVAGLGFGGALGVPGSLGVFRGCCQPALPYRPGGGRPSGCSPSPFIPPPPPWGRRPAAEGAVARRPQPGFPCGGVSGGPSPCLRSPCSSPGGGGGARGRQLRPPDKLLPRSPPPPPPTPAGPASALPLLRSGDYSFSSS